MATPPHDDLPRAEEPTAKPAREGASDRSTWVSLGEASRLLGISPGTLRRWADEGRIPVFTTPGGHRRFPRRALRGLLPAARVARPSLARLGASPERIARAYRPRRRPPAETAPPDPILGRLSDDERARFRERGRRLVGLLIEHLDAPDRATRELSLQAAQQVAAEHGRVLADLGLSLTDAVAAFLRFRAPFLAELATLARRRSLDTREATLLLTDADRATDALLVAMMTGHTLATGRRLVEGGQRPVPAGSAPDAAAAAGVADRAASDAPDRAGA
jgi:excisionase family DNA binding protein